MYSFFYSFLKFELAVNSFVLIFFYWLFPPKICLFPLNSIPVSSVHSHIGEMHFLMSQYEHVEMSGFLFLLVNADDFSR